MLSQTDIECAEESVKEYIHNRMYNYALRTVVTHKLSGYTCTQHTLKRKYNLDYWDAESLSFYNLDADEISIFLIAEIIDKYFTKRILIEKKGETIYRYCSSIKKMHLCL